jgi:hypothetical protein
MPGLAMEEARPKAPWHLWVVGVLSLLWNASGAWVIMSAQSGATMDMDPREIAYYAEQPQWLAALSDIALIAAVLAAIALLLRSRWAAQLYGLSIAAIVVATASDVARGTALMLQDQGWMVLEAVTVGLAILQWAYALAMRRRGGLR